MLKFLPLLLSGLQRRKLRTIFTLASVIVAFVLYGVLAAVKSGFTAGVEVAGADRLMTTQKVSFIQPLPLSYWQRIRSIPGVRDATHLTWFGGNYQDNRDQLQVFPVDPESYLAVYSDIAIDDADRQRWMADRGSALIGRTYAKRFGWKVGDRIPMRSTIYRRTDGGDTWDMTIAGIYDAKQEGGDTQSVYFHYDYFDEARNGGKGEIGWYVVKIDNPQDSAKIAAAIDAEFANSPDETKTSTEKAFLQGFANQIGSIGAIVTAVATAVFFTMLLVTANTMAQSVRERTGEIGVLKTLGFKDRSVLLLVLAESVFITTVGGAIGLLLASGMVRALSEQFSQYLGSFLITARTMTIGVGLMIALGLAAGALPATQALRLKISNALRQE